MKQALLFAAALACFACGNENASEATDNDVSVAPEAMPITLEPKSPGTDFPDATIKQWQYADNAFKFDVDASTYTLGSQTPDVASTMCANSDKGQHIHLIVDNAPYAAKYEAEFAYDLEDGDHKILAFLSRSYHESIKTAAAHKAVTATSKGGSFTNVTDITEPMLFYSRPKGNYVGKDTENLLLDFYPVNAPLGADYQVKVEVAGETFMVDKWQPYILRGLPMGDNTVTLTLVDAEGKRIDAPLNPVSRTFTLSADPIDG